MFEKIKDNPHFWQAAFFFAVLLLLGAHKLSIEAMVGTK